MTPLQEHLFFLVVTVLPTVSAMVPAWLAWTGRYRNWARQPNSVWSTTKYNYFPLYIGWVGITWSAIWVTIWVGYFIPEWEASLLSKGILLPFLVPPILLNFWFPRFLTPKWHQDWVARGGSWDTPLRTPDGP